MNNRELTRKYKSVNIGEVAMPVCIRNAKGNTLYDIEGNAFLDFTSGYGVTSTGWNRPEVISRIQEQLERLSYSPPWFPTQEAVDLSGLLLRLMPENGFRCARAVSGAEANETILKASFEFNGKKEVLSLSRSYHGGSKFTVNMSDFETFKLPQIPSAIAYHKAPTPYCYRCPFGKNSDSCASECALEVDRQLKDHPEIGIFFVEPAIGSGGAIFPPLKYFVLVQEICKAHQVTLVMDEVITGFGRLGAMSAMELFGITPDAASFGKGMGGGTIPIAASLLSQNLSDALTKYEDVSATFAWTPLACAAAIANIDLILKEDLPAQAASKGKYLLEQLQFLFDKYLPEKTGEIRGKGLLIGVELVEDQKTKKPDHRLMQVLSFSLLRNGLMICASWDFQVLLFMPPLNISEAEIHQALSILESQLLALSRKKVPVCS